MVMMSCLFMFYFTLKSFFLNKSHLLMMLLSLEFLVLVVFLGMIYLMINFDCDYMLLIYFMIITVCEAILGLILLTLLVRSHGSDYLKSLVFILC